MEKSNQKRIRRIVLIGPESTGKTELAQYLSNKFNTVFVPEYARDYIEKLGRKYRFEDVEHIAQKQVQLETLLIDKANKILFYDTYLIITKVWFQIVFNRVPEWIDKTLRKKEIDLFLLCNTDIEWVSDPVRENGGEMREKLFHIYKQEIQNYGFRCEIITGKGQERFNQAYKLVNDFINKNTE